jgi:hypothetical protein
MVVDLLQICRFVPREHESRITFPNEIAMKAWKRFPIEDYLATRR